MSFEWQTAWKQFSHCGAHIICTLFFALTCFSSILHIVLFIHLFLFCEVFICSCPVFLPSRPPGTCILLLPLCDQLFFFFFFLIFWYFFFRLLAVNFFLYIFTLHFTFHHPVVSFLFLPLLYLSYPAEIQLYCTTFRYQFLKIKLVCFSLLLLKQMRFHNHVFVCTDHSPCWSSSCRICIRLKVRLRFVHAICVHAWSVDKKSHTCTNTRLGGGGVKKSNQDKSLQNIFHHWCGL